MAKVECKPWQKEAIRMAPRIIARRGFVCLLLLATALFWGVQGSASSAKSAASSSAGRPIDIGAILPLTGDGAAFGPGMEAAARIAVNEVNAAGGPLGRPFKLHVEDDATNPDQGVRAAHKLIDTNHVKAIFGTWATAVTLAVFPLTVKAHILHMNVSGAPQVSTLQPPGKHTIFTINATDTALSRIVASMLRKRGYRTVTIMANNDTATSTFAKRFSSAFKGFGGSVLTTVEYPGNQASYTTEVGKALRTKPNVFLLSCYTSDGSQVLKAAYQAGSNAKWVVPAWCLNDQLVRTVGSKVVEGDFAFDLIPVKGTAAYKRLAKSYRAKTHDDIFSNVYAAHVYDSVHLLALAIQRAGTLEPHALGRALIAVSNPPGRPVSSFAGGKSLLKAHKRVHYFGAGGPIELNRTGDMSPYVGLFQMKNGKAVLKATLFQHG